MAAQKIEFIEAPDTAKLKDAFAAFVGPYEKDARFIIEPIGFVYADGEYKLAVSVSATHKTTFAEGGDTPSEGLRE